MILLQVILEHTNQHFGSGAVQRGGPARGVPQNHEHYRAFQIDPGGRVFGCVNLVCDDDEQAKREAAALVLVHRVELWRLDRRIAKFDARPDVVRQ